MTNPQVVDLHDGGTLVAADTAALLPSAALAGAQVRSAAEQVARFLADSGPEVGRPRALVVVGGTAAVDAALLTALIGDNSPVPVVASTALPGWVGPLDVVVVLAGAVADMVCAEAAAQASRRGAWVVVRASADGPVAGAAGRALLEPQVSVPEALAGVARLTVLAAVAAAAGLYPRPDFAAAADQLDAMAMACHPSSEFFVNPALTLAEHLATGTPLLIGTDPVADALGAHACRSLAGLAGCAGAWLTAAQAAGSPPVLARATSRGATSRGATSRGGGPAAGAAGDIFWDPYDDAGDQGQQISTVLVVGPSAHSPTGPLPGSGLLATEASAFGVPLPAGPPVSPLVAALEAAVPRAMRIGPEELPSSATAEQEVAAGAPGLRQRDAFTWTVSMLSRIDFAAVYVGLLTHARPPADSPDGLGRSARAVQHLPSPAGPAPWSERESGSWS